MCASSNQLQALGFSRSCYSHGIDGRGGERGRPIHVETRKPSMEEMLQNLNLTDLNLTAEEEVVSDFSDNEDLADVVAPEWVDGGEHSLTKRNQCAHNHGCDETGMGQSL